AGQHRHRHRAQPRRHQDRRLRGRPRARGRRRRRRRGRLGHARGRGAVERVAHRHLSQEGPLTPTAAAGATTARTPSPIEALALTALTWVALMLLSPSLWARGAGGVVATELGCVFLPTLVWLWRR